MNLLVFDFGGTTVKYTVWHSGGLAEPVESFPTPRTWNDTKAMVLGIKQRFSETYQLAGAAFSFPGCVDQQSGQILGYSAISYIHHFPIKEELEALLGLPIAFENDANCAALAEVWTGVAKDLTDVLFVVVGTGIGGAIVVDGKIRHGAHLYGGEFGFMFMNRIGNEFMSQTLSGLGTAVTMAQRYCVEKGLPKDAHSGREVFELAKQGDTMAQAEVETFYRYLSTGIFNLQMSFDPQAIIIGGGLSANQEILDRVASEVNELLTACHIKDFKIDLRPCHYFNDANLVGAVKNYLDRVVDAHALID